VRVPEHQDCGANLDPIMPTLVTDLTPPQRAWLFETFGHYGENDELQPLAPYQPGRFSDAQNQRDHPYHQYNHPQPPVRDFHDHGPDNRNTIFRRGGRPPSITPYDKDLQAPIPWSPAERPENHHLVDSRVCQIQQRLPFQYSNVDHRVGTSSPPQDLLEQQQQNIGGTRAPVYPHEGEKLTWLQSFENLKVYKRTYGDCNVPQKYKGNVKLGGWVVSVTLLNTFQKRSCATLNAFLTTRTLLGTQNKQRKKKKNPHKYGKLNDDHIEAMESLGFKWNVEQVC
jgi:hypothetical protein